MTSVWKRTGDFEVPLRQFSSDFRALIRDVESAYKLGHRDVVYMEVRPYGDFVEWAKSQEPDWDRYAWDGTKVLVEQGRLPKSALDNYDNPGLERAGITADEWYQLGFEHYVNSIARSIAKGDNVPPLVEIPNGPIDGRHRALAALKLGLRVAPVIELDEIRVGFGAAKQSLRKIALAFASEASELLWYEHPDVSEGGCADVSELIVEAGRQVGLDIRIVYGWARPNNGAPTPHAWLNIYGKQFDPTWPVQEIHGSDYREDPRVGEVQLKKPAFCEIGLTRKVWARLLNEILSDPKIRSLIAQLKEST